jgi:hypothetical protein
MATAIIDLSAPCALRPEQCAPCICIRVGTTPNGETVFSVWAQMSASRKIYTSLAFTSGVALAKATKLQAQFPGWPLRWFQDESHRPAGNIKDRNPFRAALHGVREKRARGH